MIPGSEQGPDTLVTDAGRVRTPDELAALLRALRRRHARRRHSGELTYHVMASRAGCSQTAIAEYFTARTIPPTDRFDSLVGLLGAPRPSRAPWPPPVTGSTNIAGAAGGGHRVKAREVSAAARSPAARAARAARGQGGRTTPPERAAAAARRVAPLHRAPGRARQNWTSSWTGRPPRGPC